MAGGQCTCVTLTRRGASCRRPGRPG